MSIRPIAHDTVTGKLALLHTREGLSVPVWITQSREAFGRLDYEITPNGIGYGLAWVSAERVEILDDQPEN